MRMVLPTAPRFHDDSFSVTIRANTDGKELKGWSFEVTYDNTALRLIGAAFSNAFDAPITNPQSCCASASGTFAASTASGPGETGTDVYLATLTFQVRGTASENAATLITGIIKSMLDAGRLP